MNRSRTFLGIAAAGLIVGLWFGLTAPPDTVQGEFSRIINIHVPSLWLAFLAFVVTAVGSVMWLIGKHPKWDRLAAASVEIGVLFTAVGLVTGMLWGNAVWGRAWDWGDPRLASTAVMFFVYLAYVALRSSITDPITRARRSAILGTIAVIQVPLVYFSVNLWRTLHQTQSIRPDGSTLPEEMLTAMLVNVVAFTLLYAALMYVRVDLTLAESSASEARTLAGEDIRAPLVEEVEDV